MSFSTNNLFHPVQDIPSNQENKIRDKKDAYFSGVKFGISSIKVKRIFQVLIKCYLYLPSMLTYFGFGSAQQTRKNKATVTGYARV